MKQTLRVRPSNPKDAPFEEIGTTKDVSQDGVYFVTERDVYSEGMRLYVTVPFHSPFSQQNYEYLGQVLRVDELGTNQRGIAVRFLSSADKKSRKN
jgi:PilZ domain